VASPMPPPAGSPLTCVRSARPSAMWAKERPSSRPGRTVARSRRARRRCR
jgi:hypothetical protein